MAKRLGSWASEDAAGYLSEAQDAFREAKNALGKRKCAMAQRALKRASAAISEARHVDSDWDSPTHTRITALSRSGGALAFRILKMKRAKKCGKG